MEILKKIGKGIAVVLGAIVIVIGLFYVAQLNRVYGTKSTELINPKVQTFHEIMEISNEITIEKKLFAFRKHYFVLSDGVLVGEVKGRFFPIFGDKLELRDVNNKVIKQESQIKRLGLTQVKMFNISINRLAQIEDANGKTTGYIGEEKLKDFWKIKRIQYFYNSDYKRIGSGQADALLFGKDYKIFDNEDNVDYVIDGSFFSPTSKFTITIKDKSDVEVEDAIFFTIIENSIMNQKVEEAASSSSKK